MKEINLVPFSISLSPYLQIKNKTLFCFSVLWRQEVIHKAELETCDYNHWNDYKKIHYYYCYCSELITQFVLLRFESVPFQWYLLIPLYSPQRSIDPWHRLTAQVGHRMYSISSVVLKSHFKMSLITFTSPWK